VIVTSETVEDYLRTSSGNGWGNFS